MDIILILVSLGITMLSQVYITTSYSQYKKVKMKKEMTGFEVARTILDKHGLKEIYITETSGVMTDHYDSARKVIRLSTEVFHGSSLASSAIAAHEVGHAIQDKEGYSFLQFRSLMFPIVNFASYAGYFAILIGILFSSLQLIWIGIGMEVIILLFQLVTLPVEFDASKRAMKELETEKILTTKEKDSAKTVLIAASLTYVAGVLTTILQILRLILIFGRNDRD